MYVAVDGPRQDNLADFLEMFSRRIRYSCSTTINGFHISGNSLTCMISERVVHDVLSQLIR